MELESDNIGLLPYNFDPEYLVEEINSRQYFSRNLINITHLLHRYLMVFFSCRRTNI